MPKFVKASSSGKKDVLYETSDGKSILRSGGTRTWRNNNPGNAVHGSISRKNGEIGTAGGFAVFPDYENGRAALIDVLQITYKDATLEKMMEGYAPPRENKTKKYLNFLLKKVRSKATTKVRELTKDQFERLWKAIEQFEGWKEGKEIEIKASDKPRILKVEKHRGIIEYYLVASIGWVLKKEAIKLVLAGQIDAVVVRRGSGTYLRSRPNCARLRDLT